DGGVVLDEQEKLRILERVGFERDLKKSLDDKPEGSKRWAWLESKLGLLVVGALITGIFVPWFQRRQENDRWRLQNRYDDQKYTIPPMRDVRKDCTGLSAFPAKAYELTRPFIEASDGTEADPKDFATKFAILQSARFEKNAAVAGSLFYFPSADALRRTFNDYLGTVSTYMRKLEEAVSARAPPDRCADEPCRTRETSRLTALGADLDRFAPQLDDSYESVVRALRADIGRMEDDRKQFE